MKLTFLRSAAAVSLLAASAWAATRPHYGGTLRASTAAVVSSLDPSDSSQTDSVARRNISRLLFDTLVVLDSRGIPQPGLAKSWQSDSSQQRWQFSLRTGVTFSDGTPLTAESAAAALRMGNPNWRVVGSDGVVSIDTDSSSPALPAELALTRNSIVRRDGGKIIGTGPFAMTRWDQGRKLTVTARDDYWNGRVYLDSIEIEMGKNLREQAIALDLGRSDLIEMAPEQLRRANTEGRRVESSDPTELVALVFSRDSRSQEEARQREALSLSIDRNQLSRVLLQGGADPAGGLLPNWLSGYSFLFTADPDIARAKQIRGESRQPLAWTVAYDANDPMSRVLAERIALNARDVGITLQPTAGNADMRVVRVPLASLEARVALVQAAMGLGIASPKLTQNSPEALFQAENAILQSRRVLPLLHVRIACATSASLQEWNPASDGSWQVTNAWMLPGK